MYTDSEAIARKIAREIHRPILECRKIVRAVFGALREQILEDRHVRIKSLGTFHCIWRNEKRCGIGNSPAGVYLKFKTYKRLKEALNEPTKS